MKYFIKLSLSIIVLIVTVLYITSCNAEPQRCSDCNIGAVEDKPTYKLLVTYQNGDKDTIITTDRLPYLSEEGGLGTNEGNGYAATGVRTYEFIK